MSADDADDETEPDEEPLGRKESVADDPLAPEEDPLAPENNANGAARERIGEASGRAIESFDEGAVDLLSWILDTETRARIYVYLRQHSDATSKEVADGTGLYPSTVREALAELHEEETVVRQKRQSEGAGNNPYEYAAIPPSDLVGGVVGDIQRELNAVFNLDGAFDDDVDTDTEPVTISVTERDAEDDDD